MNPRDLPLFPKPGGNLLVSSFVNSYPILWVRRPESGMWFPFWPDTNIKDTIVTLLEGKSPNTLPADARELLFHAQVLKVKHELESEESPPTIPPSWDTARNQLRERNYCELRGLINPVFLAGIRSYFRNLVTLNYFRPTRKKTRIRDIMYNDPTIVFLHLQTKDMLSYVTESDLRPTFSIMGLYHPGGALHKHVDRPQCEWNISLALDQNPEDSNKDTIWPLYLEAKDGTAYKSLLEMGDGCLYQGTKTHHWRDPLTHNYTLLTAFMHYVTPSYDGVIR